VTGRTTRMSGENAQEARQAVSGAKRGIGRALTQRPVLANPGAGFDAATARISEASWQRTVMDLFRLHGWRVWHDTTAWRSDAGWPDLVCTHRVHGLRFLELKREGGRVSTSQASWHADLAAAGHPVHVLRPSDWERAQQLARGERP
jgi:hypothetical protein